MHGILFKLFWSAVRVRLCLPVEDRASQLPVTVVSSQRGPVGWQRPCCPCKLTGFSVHGTTFGLLPPIQLLVAFVVPCFYVPGCTVMVLGALLAALSHLKVGNITFYICMMAVGAGASGISGFVAAALVLVLKGLYLLTSSRKPWTDERLSHGTGGAVAMGVVLAVLRTTDR